VYTLVDVTDQPELKAALLSGQLNVAVCPNCRTASMLSAPIVYHDANKQLCLVYFPQELNARPEEQERFVGEATSFIIRSLPAEAPRAYLLNPRRFLTLPTLLDTILEADGISREMLDAQRRHVEVISALAGALESDEAFAAAVDTHKADLTPELFATLNAFVQSAPAGADGSRELLEQLQQRLADLIEGVEAEAEEESAAEQAAAIARLREASDEELELAVAEMRPVIDYGFFAAWTEQIEAAEAAGDAATATALTERRTRILAIVEDMDRKAQALFEAANDLLRTVMQAPDPHAALREHADQVDETFMMILSANAGAAQRAGQTAVVQQLEALGETAVAIIQERMTPEERFINELLLAETPADATRLLRKNVAKITPELVRRLNELADQEEKLANKPIADRLRQLARESGAMLF
jgi:hypothetical protein